MKVIGRVGADILHNRISELEKRVKELEENVLALRQVLEVIRDAVVKSDAD